MKKVLVIDPDKALEADILFILSKHSYAASSWSTDNPNSEPDLVILGMSDNLDKMIALVRGLWGSKLPIIAASSAPNILSITRFDKLAGAITKPYHFQELLELVDVMFGAEITIDANRYKA